MEKSQIVNEVYSVVQKANSLFKLDIKNPQVNFYTKGRAAGLAYRSGDRVEFNSVIAKENSESFKEVIIHEIAHIVTWKLYPYAKQSHGPEFRYICRVLGGTGNTYHNFSVENVSRKNVKTRYTYKCDCKTHDLTKKMHENIISSLRKYSCKECKSLISFTGIVKKIV